MKISDLVVGNKATIILAATAATIKKTGTTPPRSYLDMTFTDGTQNINVKQWNYTGSKSPKINVVYKLVGTITEYNGAKQMTLDSMSLHHDQNLAPFVMQYADESTLNKLYSEAESLIQSISSDILRKVTTDIYTKCKQEIMQSTCALKMHHVGIGGNLAHSLQVAKIAAALASVCDANVDLCIAGALLHDIGKLRAYTISPDSIAFTMSEEGRYVEHIIAGVCFIQDFCRNNIELSIDEVTVIRLLEHIIASHHGKLEYGSAVTPICREAWIVHYADMLSCMVEVTAKGYEAAAETGSTLTPPLFMLGNREHLTAEYVNSLVKKSTELNF